MSEAMTRRSVGTGFALTAVAAAVGFVVARNSGAAKPKLLTARANSAGVAGGGGKQLASESQIPADGGVILADDGIVLTRDAAGAVQGFSAVCTHQGCTVSAISGGQISCPCHGSRFDTKTGNVTQGPASTPLPKVPVVVRGGTVFTA